MTHLTSVQFLFCLFSASCHSCRPMPATDLQLDYSLTDDFCRNHFLVGLLMREVGGALQEFREIRQIAIQVLKGLMIKHTFDDRYAAKVSSRALQHLYCTLNTLFFLSKDESDKVYMKRKSVTLLGSPKIILIWQRFGGFKGSGPAKFSLSF